jgi:hypothetical protein
MDGVGIVVVGTAVALVPNMTRTAVRQRQEEPVAAGAAAMGAAGVLAKARNV